jgi:hypothetical protein
MTQNEWTRKYKRALFERNPALQMLCIEDARKAMTGRLKELAEPSPERYAIDRASGVLAAICETRVARY